MADERTSSLGRGLDILLALATDEAVESGGLGVVRIAEIVGREKTQISRALRTLASLGWVERDEESLFYRLGWRLFALGARAGHPRIVELGSAVLVDLVARLGETTHLSVLEGAEVLTVLSELPAPSLRASGWVGRRVPASCTASGRALLSDHSFEDLERRLATTEMVAGTPRAPRSIPALFERIQADLVRGFALSDEEFEAGLVAVAAPVRNARGRVVAAVNVSGPKFRFMGALETAGRTVADAAAGISAALGYERHPGAAQSGAGGHGVRDARFGAVAKPARRAEPRS